MDNYIMCEPAHKKRATLFSKHVLSFTAMNSDDDLFEDLHIMFWFEDMKRNYINNELSADQITKLNEGVLWQNYVNNLVSIFVKKYGFSGVVDLIRNIELTTKITDYLVHDENPVGAFLSLQRKYHETKKLDKQKSDILLTLEIWKDYLRWEYNYSFMFYLNKLRAVENNQCIKEDTFIDGYYLGNWLKYQKNLYLKNKMTKDHCALLLKTKTFSQCNVCTKCGKKFHDKLQILVEAEKKTTINRQTEIDGVKIGLWLSNVKQSYVKNTIKYYKKICMTKSFTWNQWLSRKHFGNDYNKFCEKLQILLRAEKYTITVSYKEIYEGVNLYKWVKYYKKIYFQGVLNPNKLAALRQSRIWNKM